MVSAVMALAFFSAESSSREEEKGSEVTKGGSVLKA